MVARKGQLKALAWTKNPFEYVVMAAKKDS
jgi:hypothetical protein